MSRNCGAAVRAGGVYICFLGRARCSARMIKWPGHTPTPAHTRSAALYTTKFVTARQSFYSDPRAGPSSNGEMLAKIMNAACCMATAAMLANAQHPGEQCEVDTTGIKAGSINFW